MQRINASVVIPTFNRDQLLRETLTSLSRQVTGYDFEVIVVDDGSSDSTKQVVLEFEDKLEVLYIYQPDQGFRVARARNLGSKLARGEVLIYLDSGLLVGSNFIEEYIRHHEKFEDSFAIGYVYGMDVYERRASLDKGYLDAIDTESRLSKMREIEAADDPRNICYKYCSDDLTKVSAPWALAWSANVSVPKKLYDKTMGWDERYCSWGMEDVDFAYTMYQENAEFHLVRSAESIHLPHGKDHEQSLATNYENLDYFVEKFKDTKGMTAECLRQNYWDTVNLC